MILKLQEANGSMINIKKFYKENGYLPKYFSVYNGTEVNDFAPTLSTRSNGAMGSGTLLILSSE